MKRVNNSLRIIAIDVHNRTSEPLGQVTAVARAATHARVSCKPDLVVDDDMHSAAAAVVPQLAEAHGLVDNALSGKGGVAVQDDGNGTALGGVFGVELACDGLAWCGVYVRMVMVGKKKKASKSEHHRQHEGDMDVKKWI